MWRVQRGKKTKLPNINIALNVKLSVYMLTLKIHSDGMVSKVTPRKKIKNIFFTRFVIFDRRSAKLTHWIPLFSKF